MRKLAILLLLAAPVLAQPFRTTHPPRVTVANLPASPTGTVLYAVTDGASATDCTTGGGSTIVLCYWNGSSYTAVGSGSGSGDVTDVGDCSSAACFTADGTGASLFFEGTTADAFEIQLTSADPGADFVITLPAETGTACTTGSVCSGYQAGPLSGDVVTSGASATIQANSVALGTDTTGGYAASVSEAGPATTATALAANGGNCSAGQAAGGVDASGAAESCVDPILESELTNLADLNTQLGSSIADGAHTTDTGPGPDCTGTLTYQDGEGGCDTYTLSGNSTALVTTTGTQTSGDCVTIDANGNHVASGAACGVGGGGMPPREFWWDAPALSFLMPSNSYPAPGMSEGTNFDELYLGFDSAADECVGFSLLVPADVDTAGTVTFTVPWMAATATTGGVIWYVSHNGGTGEGATGDVAPTIEYAAADAVQGTVLQKTFTTWTETITNLTWAASERVRGMLCRDADGTSGTDDMADDAMALGLGISVPRS